MRDPAPGLEWTDPRGVTTLEQLLAGQGAFQSLQPDRIHAPGASGALWLRLRVARPVGSHLDWLAELPLPPLDSVTLYRQDAAGAWRGWTAGDKLAVASGPEPGHCPIDRLEVPPGQVHDAYFRIARNARSSSPGRSCFSARLRPSRCLDSSRATAASRW